MLCLPQPSICPSPTTALPDAMPPQVSSYGVFPHYSLITFASEPHVVISTQDARSADANWVREQLEGLKYKGEQGCGNPRLAWGRGAEAGQRREQELGLEGVVVQEPGLGQGQELRMEGGGVQELGSKRGWGTRLEKREDHRAARRRETRVSLVPTPLCGAMGPPEGGGWDCTQPDLPPGPSHPLFLPHSAPRGDREGVCDHPGEALTPYCPPDHAYKAGTNTRAALEAVYHMLVQQEEEQLRHGPAPAPVVNSTRHVLIIMTDGEWGQTPGTHRSPPGLSRASLGPLAP